MKIQRACRAGGVPQSPGNDSLKGRSPKRKPLIRFTIPAILLIVLADRGVAADRGQLDASPTLFTVMAAINAAGYDADAGSPNNSPLRAQVREAVAAANPAVLRELKEFVAAHRQRDWGADLGQYISFALSAHDPPDFSLRFKPAEAPPDVSRLEGFQPLLARFYQEAHIDQLWEKSQPAFEAVIERYHEPVSKALLEVNAYLRNPTAGFLGRRFQIYLDLLGAPNQVQTRSYGDEYFVVITPSPEPRLHDVRHAYLHYLLDPLATKYGMEILEKKPLEDLVQSAPALDANLKSDFLLLTTECLIVAMETRLPAARTSVSEALRQGFILSPYFAEQLNAYEKQPEAMRLFFPRMVRGIDTRRETKRLSGVEFAGARPARTIAVEQRSEPAGAARTLEEAEQLYAARDLDKAREAFTRVLQETGDRSRHASAWYGLARIAVLRKEPELGEKLFQKALDSSPEPWVRAWALVYLGRLSDAAGDRRQAARLYQEALAVNGASAAARQAAEQGMRGPFGKNDPGRNQ